MAPHLKTKNLVAALALCLAPALFGQTKFLEEKFNDGGRTDLSPTTSAAWFTSAAGSTVFTNGVGGANGTLALDNGSSRTMVGYFTVNGSPVAMNVGDTVTLDILFSIDAAAVVKANGLIIGLLQSVANPAAVNGPGFTAPGARVSGDFASSNPTSHVFGSYTGYAAWTNLAGGAASLTLRKRNATAAPGTDGLNNASASWTTLSTVSGTATATAVSTDFHATLTLTRTAAATMGAVYTLTQNGSTLVNASSTDAASGYFTFDTVNVYMASGTLTGDAAGHLILKQVNVTLSNGATPPAPIISPQPFSQTVNVGDSVTFTVGATGTGPFTYAWKKNGGAPIPGATGPGYTINNVQLADAGDYVATVTNAGGPTSSNPATLTVVASSIAPSINTQPVAQTVAVGHTANFSVEATGTAPLSYQWYREGTLLPGATANTLALTNVQTSQAGNYTVTVGNSVNTVASAPALLTVVLPPVITTQPVGATVAIGAPVTFTVIVDGTPPFTYVWRKNGTPIPGATADSFTLPGAQPGDAGSYTVVVSNAGDSVTSNAAVLAVNTPPTITTQPASQIAIFGGSATFTVGASGTAPFTYQWSKDSSPIPGATSATLGLTNLQSTDAGSYSVTVTNDFGSAPSNAATLTLSAALPSSAFRLTGFATLGAGTTGGGVIPETDPAYFKVTTPLEFATAIALSNRTAGAVKVIEIMNDLNLGWNEIGSAVQVLSGAPLRSHATPKLHPTLIASGVSILDIKSRSALTIFSASGATIKHVNFNLKGTSNIIIRNLKFDEMWEWDESSKGDYDDNDWDFITLSNGSAATNIWIDHCTFTKAYDGITDFKAGTQYVTFSWCKYIGDDGATNPNSPVRLQIAALEANKAAYPFYNFLRTNGFSVEDIVTIQQGHDKGHLMGSNSLDAQNATLSATFHHQWFQNLWDRCVPRLRAGNVHDYNIYVDDVGVLAAKRLRDARAALLSTALRNTLNNTYSFNPPINGSISTEGGALLLEKSVYRDCLTPLRNNQTDVTNPIYTGKILGLDSIYSFHNTDGTTTTVRGNSTDAGNPLGPFQAPVIAFAWNGFTDLPYAYTLDDPAQLSDILALGAGAGRLTWSKDNWLKTSYIDPVGSPTITTQPASQTVSAGANVTFTVVAGGTGNTFQWKKAGFDLPGATDATLTLNNVQAANAGDYTVIVTNIISSITSSVAVLTVNPAAPTITTQPVAQSVTVGGSASFTVVATGTAPLSYQWKKGAADITGATSATLVLINIQGTDAGDYSVVVSNSVNVAGIASAPAALTVLVPPSIVTPPASQSVAVGTNVTFTVVAGGTAPFTYQWKKDTVAIPGATSDTLALSNVQAGDAASYTVTVTNAASSITSAAAILTVSVPPSITVNPLSQSVVVGADVIFSVTAVGTAPFTYQWKKGASDISGATNATLVLTNVQLTDAGDYSVVVTNPFGPISSATATLTVTVPGASDLYVSPAGLPGNPGTLASPTTLPSAITRIPAGATIWMRGGTYAFTANVPVARGNDGASGALKKIHAYSTEIPVLDFSAQTVADANRGLSLNGNFWHVKGLTVQHAGDNGIFIGGNNNIIERCITAFNADSGLQLGRSSSAFTTIAQWPSNNLILNCDSHDNKDPTNENADGFACKLTTGVGNVFRGCISHHNIDDGWDLFTKDDTGPIGSVTIDQCIAYSNGVLSDGSSSGSGDKNGFKLGGTDIAVIHVVTRCIAFNNGKNGFTWNSNPAAIRLINNLAFDNVQGNFKFDQAGPLFFNNISHWTAGNGINDRYGGNSGIATGPSNVFWFASGNPRSKNDQGIVLTNASFVSLTPPPGGFARNDDGSIALGNFGRPVSGSPLINAGSLPDASVVAELPYVAASYYEGAPDIGVVETYLNAPPTITTQPVAQSVAVGGTVTFIVAASGSDPFTYQWKKNAGDIPGATNASLVLSNVQLTDAGDYSVVVTNGFGSAPSASATLTVTPAILPVITTQPVSQSVPAGNAAVFTVFATGSPPLSYQWFKDSNPISGATSATYAIASVQAADVGSYSVTVSNAAGSVPSAAAALTLDVSVLPPTITTQPASASVTEGNGVSFTVIASSTTPLSYQWFKGIAPISGANSATFAIGATTLADAGSYSVVVTNSGGSTPSAAAVLTVTPATGVAYLTEKFNDGSRTNLAAPTSAAWFSSATSSTIFTNGTGGANGTLALDNGSSRTLIGYFTAAGSPVAMNSGDTLTLDVLFSIDAVALAKSNGIIIGLLQAGANPAAVTGTGFTASGVPNTNGRANADFASSNPMSHVFGSYTGYAAWTNLGGGASPVTVRKRIVTATPGTDGLDNASASWTQIGSASGTGTAPLVNTDFHAVLTLVRTTGGGMNLNYTLTQGGITRVNYSSSEATASFTLFDTVNIYMASATLTGDAAGHLIMKQVNVSLVPSAPPAVPPSITTAPVAQSVALGTPASFTVVAAGSPTLTYQWYKNNVLLPGKTAATLAIPSAQASDAGSYKVTVTNSISTVTSTPVSLTVTQSYAAWTAFYGLAPGQDGFTADRDADGIANLLEYYLGLNPTLSESTGMPAGKMEGSDFVFRFTHAKLATGVAAEVQVSTDLVNWSTAAMAPQLESETPELETLTVRLPLTQSRLFTRLVVTAP